MILPFPDLLLLLLARTRLSAAYPSPAGLTYLAKGQCAYAGQVVCASKSTFAICNASLTGIIQPLAVGDTRCGDFGGDGSAAPTTTPGASSTRTIATPANSQEGTLGFMKTIESIIATATTPPASSSTPKKPGKQTTTSNAVQPVTTPAPYFASGTGLEVIPVTPVPTAVATAAAAPPREGCNPGKSTCSGD